MSIGGELSLFWNERSYNAIIHKKECLSMTENEKERVEKSVSTWITLILAVACGLIAQIFTILNL